MKALSKLAKSNDCQEVVAFALSSDNCKLAIAFFKQRDCSNLPGRFGKFIRILVVEPASGKVLHQVQVGEKNLEDPNFAIAMSPDGKLLAAGGPQSVRVWDVGNTNTIRHYEGGQRPIQCLTFSPDGKQLTTSSEDNTVLVWDVTV